MRCDAVAIISLMVLSELAATCCAALVELHEIAPTERRKVYADDEKGFYRILGFSSFLRFEWFMKEAGLFNDKGYLKLSKFEKSTSSHLRAERTGTNNEKVKITISFGKAGNNGDLDAFLRTAEGRKPVEKFWQAECLKNWQRSRPPTPPRTPVPAPSDHSPIIPTTGRLRQRARHLSPPGAALPRARALLLSPSETFRKLFVSPDEHFSPIVSGGATPVPLLPSPSNSGHHTAIEAIFPTNLFQDGPCPQTEAIVRVGRQYPEFKKTLKMPQSFFEHRFGKLQEKSGRMLLRLLGPY
jgi:hypothetical protein